MCDTKDKLFKPVKMVKIETYSSKFSEQISDKEAKKLEEASLEKMVKFYAKELLQHHNTQGVLNISPRLKNDFVKHGFLTKRREQRNSHIDLREKV